MWREASHLSAWLGADANTNKCIIITAESHEDSTLQRLQMLKRQRRRKRGKVSGGRVRFKKKPISIMVVDCITERVARAAELN